MKEVKTFKENSWVTFDRTEINLQGLKYTETELSANGEWWIEIAIEDIPKTRALLGEELFEFALDGGDTITLAEDEVFEK